MNKISRVIKNSILWGMSLLLAASLILSPTAPAFSAAGANAPTVQSYIVEGQSAAATADAVTRLGGQVTSSLDILGGVGALLTPAAATRLASQPGIRAVHLNAPVQMVSDIVSDPENPEDEGEAPEGESPDEGSPEGETPEGRAPEGKSPATLSPEAKALKAEQLKIEGSESERETVRNFKGFENLDRIGSGPQELAAMKELAGKGNDSPATDYPDVTGADLAWRFGSNGRNITVAVIDTGIAPHRGLIRSTEGRSDRIVGWVDFIDGKKTAHDPNGHGTHVAGIIANSQTGSDHEWNGMAPNVRLAGIRVLDETGAGTYEKVIQGIQWAIQNQRKYNIRIINLSLVSNVKSPYWADPLNKAIMQAWARGIVVVAAAGNEGPTPTSIGVPGNNPYVITAGAFTDKYTPMDWDDDYIAPFSAAGPTLDGFVKPDVVAPGAHMVSTMLPDTYIANNHQANQVSNQYFSMAGTSQAAGVVSGISALILSRHPNLSPDEVKYRIITTAFPWINLETGEAAYSIWQQGSGRVNAFDAIYGDIRGRANRGLDINADLAGRVHYEGYSYFDKESNSYRLRGDFATPDGFYNHWDGSYGQWTGGYATWGAKEGAWSGSYATWTGKEGAWSGKEGAWSGKEGAWSGKEGAWSGKEGAWSGKEGAWSGKEGAWSGKEGAWSGKEGAWSGKEGAWSGSFQNWSGGFTTWAGGFNTWTGNEPFNPTFSQRSFVEQFLQGSGANLSTFAAISKWVDEP